MQILGRTWLFVLVAVLPAMVYGAEVALDFGINDLSPITANDWNYQRAAHLLERAGFGGTPEEVARLANMTPAEAVASLLDFEKVAETPLPEFEPSGIYPHGYKLAPLDQIVLPALITGKAYGVKATQKGKLEYQPAINEFYTLLISEHAEMRRAGQWWAECMLRTRRPLQEKLTLFWHDHFATSQEKLTDYELMLAQLETLRQHSNGNFRELLIAVSQDPAMLIWLDNKDNVKGKPNENFAREIMELFCMGEGHGYTENDIREVARAFTGWTTKRATTVHHPPKFVDNKFLHDGGAKTILGETGKFDGYQAIDVILKQPATPRFVSGKLYKWFVREELSPNVAEQLAQILVESNFALKPLLRTIFLSRDFYSAASVGTQIKGPVHFVVSTYRKLGLSTIPGVPDFMETTGSLGQVLFYPPNVAGWPDGRPWINPATLMQRGNFAHTLLFGDADTYGDPDKVVAEGYRKIPLLFPEYEIKPHIWNRETNRMEPVTLSNYDQYLTGIDSGMMKAMGDKDKEPTQSNFTAAMQKPEKETTSKMSKLAVGEKYNLAVGVYTGFVEAYNRVKGTPRTTAAIDVVGMVRRDNVTTATAAVDYFSRRLLSVPLAAERRAAMVKFLEDEIGGTQLDFASDQLAVTLKQLVHLILSSPEYQLG